MTDTPDVGLRYRAIIVHAWSGMLAILLTMLIADVVRYAMQGPYNELSTALASDPGAGGLWVLIGLICMNALVQVSVHTFDARFFRLAVFWAGIAYTLFFVSHQVAHVLAGEGFGLHTILDLTHHGLGGWACWASFRWSRRPTVAKATAFGVR